LARQVQFRKSGGIAELTMGRRGVNTTGMEEDVDPKRGLPFWKRSLDLIFILVISPAVLLISGAVAIWIKLGSSGPVFFRQKRVGYKGREFTCYKFRTMRVNAETETHRLHTAQLIKSDQPMIKLDAHRDPRLIPMGAVIRATGLDELPQLLNVLRGEMSLVGPRPCIPYEYEHYEPAHRRRFDAVPGLTGLWQVSGKNRTTFEQMIQLDVEYSQHLSLWLDARIILRTLPALWGQYCDLRLAKRAEPKPTPPPLRNPLNPITYE
jgi:lipopolysaccharide/colanic/teichoic acid biosynthesis glycosyltransferase